MAPHTWDAKEVGLRIQAIRERRGWTGRHLARRAHISHTQLIKIEAGVSPQLPLYRVMAIIEALEVTPQEFFGPTSPDGLPWRDGPSFPQPKSLSSLQEERDELRRGLPPATAVAGGVASLRRMRRTNVRIVETNVRLQDTTARVEEGVLVCAAIP